MSALESKLAKVTHYWKSQLNADEDGPRFPPIDHPMALMPRSGLPSFSKAVPLVRTLQSLGEPFDAVWVDEGPQGISLALFDLALARIVGERLID